MRFSTSVAFNTTSATVGIANGDCTVHQSLRHGLLWHSPSLQSEQRKGIGGSVLSVLSVFHLTAGSYTQDGLAFVMRGRTFEASQINVWLDGPATLGGLFLLKYCDRWFVKWKDGSDEYSESWLVCRAACSTMEPGRCSLSQVQVQKPARLPLLRKYPCRLQYEVRRGLDATPCLRPCKAEN